MQLKQEQSRLWPNEGATTLSRSHGGNTGNAEAEIQGPHLQPAGMII